MRTVLIAQRDGAFAERLAAELRHASHGPLFAPDRCARQLVALSVRQGTVRLRRMPAW